jgi:hypothetical protein
VTLNRRQRRAVATARPTVKEGQERVKAEDAIGTSRSYEPLDSGLETVNADTNQTDTVRRVTGLHPAVGWITVASTRASAAAAWSEPCLVLPPGAGGTPIPEEALDCIYTATKRLFAVHREAFGS